jgi:D-arabinose 5-phosphate isomerase GutQ
MVGRSGMTSHKVAVRLVQVTAVVVVLLGDGG